jgi:Flp pilus assembly pilin Flp
MVMASRHREEDGAACRTVPIGSLRRQCIARLPGPCSRSSGEVHPMFDLRSWRDEAGQGLAEYALILSLIAIIAIVALVFLGNQISSILSAIGAAV